MFTDPLTELDLYWIGYFRADGCISRYPKHKSGQFTQNIPYPVHELANYIGKAGKVRECQRTTSWGECTYWSISSSKMAYLLDDLGAKTELRPNIYKSIHFWRGLLDGDGSVKKASYGGNNPVIDWNGSLEDLTQLVIFLEDHFQQKMPKIHTHSTIFRFTLSGRRAWKLLNDLYLNQYSANDVKQGKALEIISADYF